MQPNLGVPPGARGKYLVPWHPEVEQAVEPGLAARNIAGALAGATVVLEDYLRAACDPPLQSIKTGADLAKFAFSPQTSDSPGRLSANLSASEADGLTKLAQGAFQFIRNKPHHFRSVQLSLHEAIYAIDAINYIYSVTRRLAAETYLDSFLSRAEVRSLLRVRHIDLDQDGVEERITTYSWQQWNGQSVGAAVVAKLVNGRWCLAGKITARAGAFGGEITEMPLAAGSSGCVLTFGHFAGGEPFTEALVFQIQDGRVVPFEVPEQASFSIPMAHEIGDHLALGHPQLLSYSRDAAGVLSRHFWGPQEFTLQQAAASEPIHDWRATAIPQPPDHADVDEAEAVRADGTPPLLQD